MGQSDTRLHLPERNSPKEPSSHPTIKCRNLGRLEPLRRVAKEESPRYSGLSKSSLKDFRYGTNVEEATAQFGSFRARPRFEAASLPRMPAVAPAIGNPGFGSYSGSNRFRSGFPTTYSNVSDGAKMVKVKPRRGNRACGQLRGQTLSCREERWINFPSLFYRAHRMDPVSRFRLFFILMRTIPALTMIACTGEKTLIQISQLKIH